MQSSFNNTIFTFRNNNKGTNMITSIAVIISLIIALLIVRKIYWVMKFYTRYNIKARLSKPNKFLQILFKVCGCVVVKRCSDTFLQMSETYYDATSPGYHQLVRNKMDNEIDTMVYYWENKSDNFMFVAHIINILFPVVNTNWFSKICEIKYKMELKKKKKNSKSVSVMSSGNSIWQNQKYT